MHCEYKTHLNWSCLDTVAFILYCPSCYDSIIRCSKHKEDLVAERCRCTDQEWSIHFSVNTAMFSDDEDIRSERSTDSSKEKEKKRQNSRVHRGSDTKRRSRFDPDDSARRSESSDSDSGIRRQPTPEKVRPQFRANSKKAAYIYFNSLQSTFKVCLTRPNLTKFNAAIPHRVPFKEIWERTVSYYKGDSHKFAFMKWTNLFIEAGDEKIHILGDELRQSSPSDASCEKKRQLLQLWLASRDAFINSRDALAESRSINLFKQFIAEANSFFANIPDLGPHIGVNIEVGARKHLHFVPSKNRQPRGMSLSPMSKAAINLSPGFSRVAVNRDNKYVGTDGAFVSPERLRQEDQEKIEKIGTQVVNAKTKVNFG